MPVRRGERRAAVVAAAWPLGLGVVLGVAVGFAWDALAPVAPAGVQVSELDVGQDGTFFLLACVAGLLQGGWVVARAGPRPLASAIGALWGAGLGSATAWGVGLALGPLTLRALGVLGIWPATTAAVMCLGLLVTGFLTRRAPPAGPPTPP